jgi:outer membrane protein TolC
MTAAQRVFFIALSAVLAFAMPASAAEQPGAGASGATQTLTWGDCIRAAAKNHPDLIASQEIIKQSEAAKKITGSSLLPQVNASLHAIRTSTSSSIGGSETHNTSNTYSYGANADQLLFDGSKTKDTINAAGENIKASQASYRFTSSDVRLRLRTAFINLLKAQDMITVTDEIAKIRRNDYELITLRYESGYEHRGALLTA